MKKITTEGFVLKNTNYKEKDKIYCVFTKGAGKVYARAFGVRKITSKRAGNLDSFNKIKISLSESNNFYTVSEVTLIDSNEKLKSDPKKMEYLYKISDFVVKSIPDDDEVFQIYKLFEDTLNLILKKSNGYGAYVNYFQIKFLDYMGYRIDENQTKVLSKNAKEVFNSLEKRKINPKEYLIVENEITNFLNSQTRKIV